MLRIFNNSGAFCLLSNILPRVSVLFVHSACVIVALHTKSESGISGWNLMLTEPKYFPPSNFLFIPSRDSRNLGKECRKF